MKIFCEQQNKNLFIVLDKQFYLVLLNNKQFIKYFNAMQNPAKISSFRVAYKKTPHVLNTEYLIVNNYSHQPNLTIQNESHQNQQTIKQKKKKLYVTRGSSVQDYKFFNKNATIQANSYKQRIKSNSLDINIKFSPLQNKSKEVLKHKTQSILHQVSKHQKLEQPIHSRKTDRFKILSGILKKYEQPNYYTQKSQSLDYHIMKIKKETLHDFNQTSMQYIKKLQKQAARAIKTAGMQCHTSHSRNRNQVRYQTRQNKRIRIKINSPQFKPNPMKTQTYRPWSREKNPQTWLYDDNNLLTIL